MMSPTVVPVGPQVGTVCPPASGNVLIYNSDITNIAYVGPSSSVTPANSTAIQPLTYAVVDGTRQLYGVCPTGTAILNVTPGGTYQSASPAQIAAQLQPSLKFITSGGINVPQVETAYFTASGPTRLWGVTQDSVVATNPNFAWGGVAKNVFIQTTLSISGVDQILIQQGYWAVAPNLVNRDNLALLLPAPIHMQAGDTVSISVNAGIALTNVAITGCGVAIYSVP